MKVSRYRVLYVCSHPVQYASPIFRRMAQHPQLDIQVAYCSMQGAEAALDRDFGVAVQWDVPLLEGFPWIHVPNRSPAPGMERFFGLINPGLWKLIASGSYDAVVILTGYVYLSFWIALIAAKLTHTPLLFGTDAHALVPRDGKNWKLRAKRWLWPRLFRLADVVIVPSTRGVELMRSLGIPDERLFLTPYVVDNDWWSTQAAQADPMTVRRACGIPQDAPVALFCAKLQPWKRPLDLLRAFAQAKVPQAHLLYAGDGPLRPQIEAEAAARGLAERVHFLGFTNQSQLPAVYRASDLLVLPSDYEPFGVVVNEAMLCGCAVIVSDRVGAGRDLVVAGQNGFIFPYGDLDALATTLHDMLTRPDELRRMGEAARKRMETWSPNENIEAVVRAVGAAVSSRNENMYLGVVPQEHSIARDSQADRSA